MITASPIPVVKPAIRTLLQGNLALTVISRDTHNKALAYDAGSIPDELEPPYTVIRSLQSSGSPLSTSSFGSRAMNLLLTLDTWSSYPGSEQIEAMHAAIHEALNEREDDINALITGFTCTYCLFDTNDQLEDDTTSIRLFHGVERYRLRMEAL